MIGVKAAVFVAAGLTLFVPLGLIALTTAAERAGSTATCAAAAATGPSATPTVSPTPTRSSTSATKLALVMITATAPATDISGTPRCDGGDGLADHSARLPAGYTLPTDTQQAAAVSYALAQIGKPYVFGTAGPDTYDCSGLVMKAWAAAGVAIPRTTHDQVTVGVAVTSFAAMQPGDLIFIPGSDGTMAHPGHVGMYIGQVAGERYLVQAPHTGTVVHVTPVSDWASQIAAIRRPFYRQ